jgi:hypothetical protein
MIEFKAIVKKLTGIGSPTSLTFWSAVLLSGIPAWLAGMVGFELDASFIGQLLVPDLTPGDRMALILGLFGIRRRLPS